jgi:hypothetical protein
MCGVTLRLCRSSMKPATSSGGAAVTLQEGALQFGQAAESNRKPDEYRPATCSVRQWLWGFREPSRLVYELRATHGLGRAGSRCTAFSRFYLALSVEAAKRGCATPNRKRRQLSLAARRIVGKISETLPRRVRPVNQAGRAAARQQHAAALRQ